MKIFILVLTLFCSTGVFGQTLVNGNPTCESLGFNRELKIEPPKAGTYVIKGIGSVTVTINTQSSMSFTTTIPPFVRAVIMKGGPNANVYSYNPATLGADLLITPPAGNGNADISHINFCYNLGSTAADIEIAGKVVNIQGRAISGVVIQIYDPNTGNTKLALSNPFGYYKVEGLTAGGFYVLQATHKNYKFEPRGVTAVDSLQDYDFIGVLSSKK